MLDLWLRRTLNATWEDVARALEQMGEKRVAENILQIHGEGKSQFSPLQKGTLVKTYEELYSCQGFI